MSWTRRAAILGTGATGATHFSALGASAAPLAPSPEDRYLAPYVGSRPRSIDDKLSERISVLDFGAVGDGRTDDTQAMQAAADAAAKTARTLFLPATPGGYLVTDTININCRRITGDGGYLNSQNAGTLVHFRPRRASDLMPCFAIRNGMYMGATIENIGVIGPFAYSWERLGEVIDASRLPDYSAFAPGVCAFAVYGYNQPSFHNVTSKNVKVGLLLDNGIGHVSSYDCLWDGLIGVYCHRNTEDFFFMGGQITGTFAGVIFGTLSQANHNGGMTVDMYRVHMGFSPYCFYQVKDAPFIGPCLTVRGRLDAVRFERVGEAIFQFLPESQTMLLSVDDINMTWSPLHTAYPKPPPSRWLTNLPPSIIPYDLQQRHLFAFGALGRDVRLGWLKASTHLRRSPYARNPGALASIQSLSGGDAVDLDVLHGDFEVAGRIYPNSWVDTGSFGPPARRGDTARNSQIAPAGNLLLSPEVPANWRSTGGQIAAAAQSQDFSAQGGKRNPGFQTELGGEPIVLQLKAGNQATVFKLPLHSGTVAPNGQTLYFSLWASGSSLRTSFELAGGQFYDQTTDASKGWAKVIAIGQVPPSPMIALWLEVPAGSTCQVAGVMAAFDGPCPYNPRPFARIRGGLALDEFVDAPEHPSPSAKPAGYLSVEIDGQTRQIPYY